MQSDRPRYKTVMKKIIENQDHLQLVQAEITAIEYDEEKNLIVKTALGAVYQPKSVVIAAGTYFKRKNSHRRGQLRGRTRQYARRCRAFGIAQSPRIKLLRFKTGTRREPMPRALISAFGTAAGRQSPEAFSYDTDPATLRNDFPCFIAWTNEKTHEVIRKNLHRSPLFAGVIEGIGPRYCPSIEDKVVRFADKTRHQIFIEPTAADSCEVYIQACPRLCPRKSNSNFCAPQGL
jgi:tRNA uridine 5-carboxymethylaminomethyl modification enzyme